MTPIFMVVELHASELGLVWLEGRIEAVLEAGIYALWKSPRDVVVEIFEVGLREHVSLLLRAERSAEDGRAILRDHSNGGLL